MRPGPDTNTGRLSVVGVPVNMMHMFPQSLVLLSVHHLLGPHSAHCAADRGLSQVQLLDGCGRACCCAMTGALFGSK